MKNKVLLVLAITFMIGTAAYTQNQQIGKTFTRSFVDTDFSVDKVYNKATGSKVSPSDFRKLTQENPRLHLEREIDEEGHVVRYLYDPNAPAVSSKTNLMTNIPEKGAVPNFKVKSIDGKKIELNKLQGKLVILRFEQGAGDFRFKKNEIAELDKKINSLKDKENVEGIIIFECPEEEVRNGFDLKDSNFNVVANGQNFGLRYDVHFYPTTLLIDQTGKLIKVFFYSDDINLEEYIN